MARTANQASCFIKQTQAINCVLLKNKHLTEQPWVRRTGAQGDAKVWLVSNRDLCFAQVPHQSFPIIALQKPQYKLQKIYISCSMEAILTTLCWQVYGHCKHRSFNSNGLSCNRSQRALQNPSRNVIKYQSKEEYREIAHKAQRMWSAGLQGTTDAKVCMGSKKQANSQLKNLHWVQFNAGLHLLLRGPSQKLVGARWSPLGRILYADLAPISSPSTHGAHSHSQVPGQGGPWFDPAKLYVLTWTIRPCFMLCICTGWSHPITQSFLIKSKTKKKSAHCKGADTLFPSNKCWREVRLGAGTSGSSR